MGSSTLGVLHQKYCSGLGINMIKETITPEDLKLKQDDNASEIATKYLAVICDHPVLKNYPNIDEIKSFDEHNVFKLESIIWKLRRWAYKRNIIVG